MVLAMVRIASLQRLYRGQSAAGTPSNSAITRIGSGTAKSLARSISPRSITSSRSWRDRSRMRGSKLATTRGVNALVMRALSFVWRGGSKKRNHSPGLPRPGACDRSELKVSCSTSARLTPSKSKIIQASNGGM
jgi:hypothetical protein